MDANALERFANTAESPFMSLYTVLKPKGPIRAEQVLVFPDPRYQYHLRWLPLYISCLGV